MRNDIGYQVGVGEMLPFNEASMLNLILSALFWQEERGPCVIMVDEKFYIFLLRTGIETIYQDIIPILTEMDTIADADNYAESIFDGQKLYKVPDLYSAPMDKADIGRLLELLPPDIQERWETLLMNEELILSLGQKN